MQAVLPRLSFSPRASPLRSAESSNRAIEIMRRMSLRRGSTKDWGDGSADNTPEHKDVEEDETETLHRALQRLESEVKGQLEKMESKLDTVCAASLSIHRALKKRTTASSYRQSIHPMSTIRRNSTGVLSDTASVLSGGERDCARESTALQGPSVNCTSKMMQPSSAWLGVQPIMRRDQRTETVDTTASVSPVTSHRSQMTRNSDDFDEMIRSKIDNTKERRHPFMVKVWHFLEEPESSTGALYFSRLLLILVIANVTLSLVQSTEPSLMSGMPPNILQLFFDIFCVAEVTLRFVVSPHRCRFFTDFFNWVDILAGSALVLRAVLIWECGTGAAPDLHRFLHCVVPVVWLLKLLRTFEQFHLLLSAFEMALEALPVLLYALAILTFSFAALIYYVEPRETMLSLPASMWFTTVTIMTVGYGDVYPSSAAGKTIACALMISSTLYMAIPLGIVGGCFSRVWEDRDRLLLIRRTRLRLSQWGYTAQDLLQFFYFYDSSRSGELDIDNFKKMISDMRLGLHGERINRLFRSLDQDHNGWIDNDEFIEAIYPDFEVETLHHRVPSKAQLKVSNLEDDTKEALPPAQDPFPLSA